jgi:type IV pilus assembly protein PilV
MCVWAVLGALEFRLQVARVKAMSKQRQQGATMIEVLISILLLVFGMMGLAALQGAAIKSTGSSFSRSQAANLASDIADRIRANKRNAKNYVLSPTDEGPTGTEPHQKDLNKWLASVKGTLPEGKACIAYDQATKVLTTIVFWNDTRQTGSAPSTCVVPSTGPVKGFEFKTTVLS